jgi:hypothetical protein
MEGRVRFLLMNVKEKIRIITGTYFRISRYVGPYENVVFPYGR